MNKTVLTAALILSGIAQANELHPLCMSEEEETEWGKIYGEFQKMPVEKRKEIMTGKNAQKITAEFGDDYISIYLMGDAVISCLKNTADYYAYFKYTDEKDYNKVREVYAAYFEEVKKINADKERKEKAEKEMQNYISSLGTPVK